MNEHFSRAIAFEERGKYRRALDEYLAALDEGHETAVCLHNAGRLSLILGNLDDADALLRKALEKDPDDPLTWTEWSRLAIERALPTKALEAADRAIHIDPTLAMAHNNRGAALFLLERYVDAEAAFRQALRLAPGLAEAEYNLADCRSVLDRLAHG